MQSFTFSRNIKRLMPKPVYEFLLRARHFGRKLPNRAAFEGFTRNKRGLEIGGPSIVFRTTLGIYQGVSDLDGVNFSQATVWEGSIQKGKSYNYIGNKKGLQFIADATDLSQISADSYDFVLSSNCL